MTLSYALHHYSIQCCIAVVIGLAAVLLPMFPEFRP